MLVVLSPNEAFSCKKEKENKCSLAGKTNNEKTLVSIFLAFQGLQYSITDSEVIQ